MRIVCLALSVCGLAFSPAHASTPISLGSGACSGTQTFDASNGLSYSCSGDLSLSEGSLSSDTGISLTATGDLSLDAFTLSAPLISLNAAFIRVSSSSSLRGDSIVLSATNGIVMNGLISPGSTAQILSGQPLQPSLPSTGTITVLPGRDINLGGGTITVVPLPASFPLLLTGLLTLLAVPGGSVRKHL